MSGKAASEALVREIRWQHIEGDDVLYAGQAVDTKQTVDMGLP